MSLKSGQKYRLRSDARSKLGLAPDEVLTYQGSFGGGKIKDELLPIEHRFLKTDGSLWVWKKTTGELLSGWLEEIV